MTVLHVLLVLILFEVAWACYEIAEAWWDHRHRGEPAVSPMREEQESGA